MKLQIDTKISVFPLIYVFLDVKISSKPGGGREGGVGAAALFTRQEPPASPGGLKPTSRLPSAPPDDCANRG